MGDDAGEAICCLIVLLILALIYPPTRGYAIAIVVIIALVLVGLFFMGRGSKKTSKPSYPQTQPQSPQSYGYSYPTSPKFTIRCSSCGFENSQYQSFCGRCGASLKGYQKQKKTRYNLQCAHCGYINPDDNRYCGRCGASLEQDGETKLY